MWQAETIRMFRDRRGQLDGTVAVVPTMGALHEGHLSLIRRGLELADHVVATIFVNPTQFGPGEDFDRYPRQLERDLKVCADAGAAGVFCPVPQTMYPPNQLETSLTVPALENVLEGAFRPGHFAGVCRVVAKLLNITQPDVALFGRKDYQQLRVIETMVDDLNLPVRVEGCPTLREPDGLAMSSRNRYLTDAERHHALGLYKTLSEAKLLVESAGEADPGAVEAAMAQSLRAHQVEVDYAVIRHPQTLTELDCIEPALTGGVIALIAGRVGKTRLIDNMLLGASEPS